MAFRAIATPEMEPVLREILKDGDRGSEHQAFTDFVLRVIDEGVALPTLSGILLEIVAITRGGLRSILCPQCTNPQLS